MTLAELIPLALNASIFLVVFALGLQCTRREAFFLFRNPGLLVRSILSMNGVMLVFAVVVALTLDIPVQVKVALVALAVSPVPPVLPAKQKKAGGSDSYVVGLLFAASVIAIVLIPAAIETVGRVFGTDAVRIPFVAVAKVVFTSIVLPLALGIITRRFFPGLAERFAKPISLFATALLFAAFVPIVIKIWPTIQEMIGNGVVLILVAFSLLGLVVGHFLGGPDPDDRAVLALATSTRHPGVAMMVVGMSSFTDPAVSAVIIFHLVMAALVTGPYVAWRKRLLAANAVAPV